MSCQKIGCQEMSRFNISFSGVFKSNLKQQTIHNISKAIISSYNKLLLTEERKVTLITAEDKIEINDTMIAVKSNVPKNENGWFL
jgi:hypothetical protein